MLEELDVRIKSLNQQLNQINQNILSLAENLAQTKAQAQQLIGHINESQFLKEEYKKHHPENKDDSTDAIKTENVSLSQADNLQDIPAVCGPN